MATTKIQGNASGSGSVTITAPNTNSNRTVTLPDADLTIPSTNSTNVLTTQGDILYASGANTLARLAKGAEGKVLKMGGSNIPVWGDDSGKILQVIQATKTDTASRTASGWADIPDMTVSITPANGTKILVHYTIQTSHTNGARFAHTRLFRDSTQIGLGDADSNRSRTTTNVGTPAGNGDYMLQNQTMLFLDTHGADGSTAVTYKLQWWIDDRTSQSTIWINRTLADSDAVHIGRAISAITVMEVAA